MYAEVICGLLKQVTGMGGIKKLLCACYVAAVRHE